MQVKVEYHLQGMMVEACAEDITRQNLRTDIQAVPLLDIEIEEVHFIEDPQLPRITVTGVNLEVQCHFGLAFLLLCISCVHRPQIFFHNTRRCEMRTPIFFSSKINFRRKSFRRKKIGTRSTSK